jgi:hypothetical protein
MVMFKIELLTRVSGADLGFGGPSSETLGILRNSGTDQPDLHLDAAHVVADLLYLGD